MRKKERERERADLKLLHLNDCLTNFQNTVDLSYVHTRGVNGRGREGESEVSSLRALPQNRRK